MTKDIPGGVGINKNAGYWNRSYAAHTNMIFTQKKKYIVSLNKKFAFVSSGTVK